MTTIARLKASIELNEADFRKHQNLLIETVLAQISAMPGALADDLNDLVARLEHDGADAGLTLRHPLKCFGDFICQLRAYLAVVKADLAEDRAKLEKVTDHRTA